MKALIDTNVIMDFIAHREPFYDDAAAILELCARHRMYGLVAVHTVPTLFYLMRRFASIEQRRLVLLDLLRIVDVAGANGATIMAALANGDFYDIEDSIQHECARSVKADIIITRDTKHFINSSIKVVTPHGFLQ